MDLFYPAILEVPVIDTNVTDEILSSFLPNILTPLTIPGIRNASGRYKRLTGSSSTYVYHFHNMTPASGVTLQSLQYNELLNRKEEETLAVEVTVWQEFVPPDFFVPVSNITVFINSAAREVAKSVTVSFRTVHTQEAVAGTVHTQEAVTDTVVKAMTSIQTTEIMCLAVKGGEVEKNQYLVNWLTKYYSDKFEIKGNECLTPAHVTIYQSSKPDFCLFPLCNRFCAVYVTTDFEELLGVAGECKENSNSKAQTIANMIAAAGYLAREALLQSRKFSKITIYGLQCSYSSDLAAVKKLTFDFRRNSSDLIEYRNKTGIGKQIARVTRQIEDELEPFVH